VTKGVLIQFHPFCHACDYTLTVLCPSRERAGFQGRVLVLLRGGLGFGAEVGGVTRRFVYCGEADVIGVELYTAWLFWLFVEALVSRLKFLGEYGVVFDLFYSSRLVLE